VRPQQLGETDTLRKWLKQLSASAQLEFEDVADFFWKVPRFIEHERQLELAKLDDYFPDNLELRERRWMFESSKLNHTFPYLVATGNLFCAASLFETYLLVLASGIEAYTGIRVKDMKGQGVNRLLAFLRRIGVTPEKVQLHEQVSAAIKIRNCLMHASGMLDGSRKNYDLRRIQRTGAFLSRKHRKKRRDLGLACHEVTIVSSSLGDRLAINDQYCHILCNYLHTYFTGLCEATNAALDVGSKRAVAENNSNSASGAPT
jgi:hypothetical protein